MIELNKIYNEDCLTTLKRMDDNSIDCVVTSPPYYALRKYTDSDFEIGREHTPSEYIDNLVEVFHEVYRVLKPTGTVWVNIGDTYNGNKTGNDNPLWKSANTDSFKKERWNGCKNKDLIGIPWLLAFALRNRCGFYLRQDIIWDKANAMPEPVTDRCVKSHEYIFLFSKNEKYYFDYQAIQEPAKTFENRPFGIVRQREFDYDTKQSREPEKYGISTGIRFGGKKYGDNDDPQFATKSGKEWKPQTQKWSQETGQRDNPGGGYGAERVVRNKRDVWSVNTQPSNIEHCAMYPEKLIMPCILAGCPSGGIVYDPFGGSGTTALATIHSLENRNFILSELSPKYAEIARKRIEPELNQTKLF